MPKSRKSPASILGIGPLLWTGVLCALLAAAAIGMVWHRDRNDRLLRQNAQHQRLLEVLRQENLRLEFQLQNLTRPEALFARARVLGLDRPSPDQILRVELTPAGSPPAAARLPAVRIAARPAAP